MFTKDVIHLDSAGGTSQRCGNPPVFLRIENTKLTPNLISNYFILDSYADAKSTYAYDMFVNISIYRLYQYAYHIRSCESKSLLQIHEAISFDRQYQSIMLEYLGILETSLRARISSSITNHLGALSYLNQDFYKDNFNFDKYIKILNKEYLRSCRNKAKILAVDSYEFEDLPIWIAVELMSFGTLSNLYANIRSLTVRHEISDSFNIRTNVFISWIKLLANLRNSCVHSNKF